MGQSFPFVPMSELSGIGGQQEMGIDEEDQENKLQGSEEETDIEVGNWRERCSLFGDGHRLK